MQNVSEHYNMYYIFFQQMSHWQRNHPQSYVYNFTSFSFLMVGWIWSILAVMFGFITRKDCLVIWLSSLLCLRVHDEWLFKKNAPCALNQISKVLLLSLLLVTDVMKHQKNEYTDGGLLVPLGIIHPVVSASALTWFIRYIHY